MINVREKVLGKGWVEISKEVYAKGDSVLIMMVDREVRIMVRAEVGDKINIGV